jgi:hypothetical protein
MFPITRKGTSYFVSGSEKGISFVVSTSKRLYIFNIGTCGNDSKDEDKIKKVLTYPVF